jgi:hypothetical protein
VPDSDPASAALAGIRERYAERIKTTISLGADPADSARSIAALDAVLELADGWTLRPGDPDWARTRAMDECAGKLRDAIARELTGTGRAAHGQSPKRAPCKRIGGCLAEIGARCENPAPDLWKCSCGRTPRDITAALTGKDGSDEH